MFLTAHRLKSDSGQEGINAFLHKHGRMIDPSEAATLIGNIDENPCVLAYAECEVHPGHNSILSYLDIVADDDVREAELISARRVAGDMLQNEARSIPIQITAGPVSIRFGSTIGMMKSRQHLTDYDVLWDRAIRLFKNRTVPSWYAKDPLVIRVGVEHRANDQQAWTFELEPSSARRVRQRHGPKWMARRFSIDADTRSDFEQEHGSIVPVAIEALTDIPCEEIAAMGGALLIYNNSLRVYWPPRPDMSKSVQADESLDALCRRLTGYASIAALFDQVDRDYVPSIYLRDQDHERLANAYDAEAKRRNDPRRAARFALPLP